MSYRSDVDALNARKAALAGDVAGKQRELVEVDRLIREVEAKAKLPLLDNIRVASPCSASWAAMAGDDRRRACGECKKTVYNLSGMTRDEAQTLLEREDDLCVRYYQRTDGTIVLADCEIGAQRVRRRRRIAAVGAAAILAGAGGAHLASTLATIETPAIEVTADGATCPSVFDHRDQRDHAEPRHRGDYIMGQRAMTIDEMVDAGRRMKAELVYVERARAHAEAERAEAQARTEAATADREAAVAAAAEAQRSLDESRRLLEVERARIQRLSAREASLDGITDRGTPTTEADPLH